MRAKFFKCRRHQILSIWEDEKFIRNDDPIGAALYANYALNDSLQQIYTSRRLSCIFR